MSKPKRRVILGPDGKPYVAPPKPMVAIDLGKPGSDRTAITITTADEVHTHYGGYVVPSSYKSMLSYLVTNSLLGSTRADIRKPDLRATVADQVEAITDDFDGQGGAELPTPPRDLTTYRDAYASAAAKCDHVDAIEILYGREWTCDACGRSLNRDDMRRARPRNPFGWFG